MKFVRGVRVFFHNVILCVLPTYFVVWNHNGDLFRPQIYLIETDWEVVNWIRVAQSKDQWRALVNTVWTFEFHEKWVTSWLTEWLLASYGLCFTELAVNKKALIHPLLPSAVINHRGRSFIVATSFLDSVTT